MKKISVLLVILCLVLGVVCVGASEPVATSSVNAEYTDFVKGSINDNLVINFSDSFWHANTLNDSRVALTGINWKNANLSEDWPGGYLGASMTAKASIDTVAGHFGGAGMAIATTTNATYPKFDKDASSYKEGEHYVFVFAVRNINPQVPARLRLGVWDGASYDKPSAFIPVSEYPDGIIEVPQTGEWITVKAILPITPHRLAPAIRLGFAAGTQKDAAVEFNSRHSGVQQAYYAKETAHDINVSVVSGETEMKIGSTLSLEAAVCNQLGKKGNLSQEFDWVLLDSDKKPVTDGYAITHDGNDTSKAVFTNTSLDNGSYTLVATSKEYGISRFVVLDIKSKFELPDHKIYPEEDNLIVSPTNSSMVSSGTSNLVSTGDDGLTFPSAYVIAAKQDLTTTAHTCYEHGFLYDKIAPEGGYTAGDRYIFSAWVRNTGNTETNVIVGISNAYNVPTCYGENYGSEGMPLPADGKWYEYREILTCPGDRPLLSFGLPAGTKAGSKIEINLNNAGLSTSYFAKEKVYDIQVSSSKNKASKGETVDLSALVVNQLGDASNFRQNFTWYVLDENKNYKSTGYILTSENTEAHLNITSDKAENIYVVAVSDDYNIVRMFLISLNGKTVLTDYVKGDMPQNLIKDPASADNFSDASGNYDVTETGDYRLSLSSTFTAKNEVSDYGNAFNGASGFIIKNSALDLTNPLTGGTSYVFGASVKNANGTGDVVLDVGLSNSSYVAAAKPVETQNGYTIEAGDDWYNLVATMKLPGNVGTEYTPYFTFGFGVGTDGGDKFELNRAYPNAGSIYFAPEEAYDITVTNLSEDMTVTAGEEISFEASVLNQLGSTGYLNQNFTWYVRASDNTDASESFTVVENGKTMTIAPNGKAKSGKYTVIAVSDDYEGLVRFADIFVADGTTTLYVSADGNDRADGTEADPLRTLQGAIDKIASLREEGITINEVLFYPGEYIFTETANFTKSAAYEVPVTFRAMEKGEVIFKTAQNLDVTDFVLVEDEDIVSRFAPGMAGKIYSLDLEAAGYTPEDITNAAAINGQYGLTDQGEFNTLYYNGVEQMVSQWPDGGEYAVKGDGDQYNGDEANASDGLSFTYYREDVAQMLPSANCDRWANAKNFWISSFEPYDYSRFRYYVKSIDTENHTITICDNPAQKLENKRSGRWRAHNLIEEITLPGEYAIDIENMILYYYPQGPLDGADVEFSDFTGAMVSFEDCENIIFDSITFTRTRDDAITMTDVSDIAIVNCEFTNIASVAIGTNSSVYAESGRDSWQAQKKDGLYFVTIKGNDFINIGQTAIQISGAGNVDNLTPSGVVIEDNYINGTSNKSFWEAIILGGCGVTVRNNSISSSPMQAIRAWGSNHLIEYNEIFDVITEDADCAAIYWGGSSIYQGTVVRYNYIHHTDGNIAGGQVGVYWDDMQLGQTAKYNIFAYQDIDFNSNGAGATVHHYNTTYSAAKHLSHQDHGLRGEDTISSDLCYGSLEEIRNNIADLDLYYERYPYLESVIGDGVNPTKYTSIIGNLGVAVESVQLRENAPKYAVLKDNVQSDDVDAFNDVDAQDFRLKADSELARQNPHLLNTANFDIDKIGLTREIEMGDFETIYPKNREKLVDRGTGVTLLWSTSKGANRYNVVVATDPDFNSVVYETQTLYNSIRLPMLPVDTYYWKVSAVSISREFAGEKQSLDGVKTFTIAEITVPIYVDSEITSKNAIANPAEATNYNQFNTSSFYPQITDLRKTYSWTVKSALAETAKYDGYLSGCVMRIGGENYIDPEFTVPGGEKLIFKIAVKNAGSTDSVRVNASLINSGNWNSASYSLEYGADGVSITDKNNWTELTFTFVMPGTPGVEYSPRLVFGFPKDTPVGTAIKINLATSGISKTFVGRAEPLEISLTTQDALPVKAGGTFAVKASVTDILGTSDATNSDKLDWYVTNSGRNGIMDNPGDFTFSDVSGKKVLKIGPNAEPGEYYIIAQSVDNPNLRKGMLIEVAPADITVSEPQFAGNDITYTVTYHGADKLSFTTYVAGYDTGDNLVFANVHNITDAVKGSTHDITSTVPSGKMTECYYYKIFTWKDGLVPLAGGFKNFYK